MTCTVQGFGRTQCGCDVFVQFHRGCLCLFMWRAKAVTGIQQQNRSTAEETWKRRFVFKPIIMFVNVMSDMF